MITNQKIIISDPTLRDGSHALRHKFNEENISTYCKLAEKANVPIVEIGHGNGLGASSLQLGESLLSETKMLSVARKFLKKTRLGVHVIPGFATIEKNIKPAIDLGVDVFRIATHCTEADLSERHISFLRDKNIDVWGCLMMSHMINPDSLILEAKKMESYGATGVVFMDSAGAFTPDDVSERVGGLVTELNILIGFHGHNNLNLAIGNSLVALKKGATLIDACAYGFGAGAGNTQLEALVAATEKLGFESGIDFNKSLDLASYIAKNFEKPSSSVSIDSIISGYYGVFSGFLNPVKRIAKEFQVKEIDIFYELGQRQIIAGQEDIILEIASSLANKNGKS